MLKPHEPKIGYDMKLVMKIKKYITSKRVRQRASQPFNPAVPESDHRVDPTTAWIWYSSPATSSTCQSSGVCDASVAGAMGEMCWMVTDVYYECCFSGEGCIPNVGCRCAETGERLDRPRENSTDFTV